MTKRSPKNTSRVEVIAHKTVIEEFLRNGWNYRMIFNKLTEDNKISIKYHAFLRATKLICDVPKTSKKISSNNKKIENTAEHKPNEPEQPKSTEVQINKANGFIYTGDFIGLENSVNVANKEQPENQGENK